ncbi:MAG: biotin/lipoate A/B protein ligase family protein [Candidatus Diapherotrites archaeon]
MAEWRFLSTGFNSAAKNMSIDEAVMRLHAGDGAVVRFYGWKPSAISIGYFQSLEEEVDLQKCKELGVDFVRRITGGGAVFHDSELTYSFVCSEKSGVVPGNILDSYRKICDSLILGFKELGLTASFAPLNDIICNGKKISGNAQTRREGKVLQHGTIILKVDVEKMFSLLKVPNEKLKGKMIEDVKQRVTSVEKEAGADVGFEKVAAAMRKGFEENFAVELVEGALTAEESALAEKIARERFSQREWNFKR